MCKASTDYYSLIPHCMTYPFNLTYFNLVSCVQYPRCIWRAKNLFFICSFSSPILLGTQTHAWASASLSLTQESSFWAGYSGLKPALIDWLEGKALGKLPRRVFSGECGNSLWFSPWVGCGAPWTYVRLGIGLGISGLSDIMGCWELKSGQILTRQTLSLLCFLSSSLRIISLFVILN